MAKFSGCLDAVEIGEYDGRTVHKLNSPLIWVHEGKRVAIPAGFETDLASVPRVPIVYCWWGDRAHREAVLHDYLYRVGASIIEMGDPLGYLRNISDFPKEEADWLFREAMIGQGVSWTIYHPMYAAVRCAGGSSFHRMKVMDKFTLDVEY